MRKNVFNRNIYRHLLVSGLFVTVAIFGLSQARADESVKAPVQESKPDLSAPAFVPGSWTLVILPDIQNYATQYPGLLELQTRWIAENKDKYNIAYTLELGDLTNCNSDPEWQRVDKAFKILDAADMPYALVPGNHDYSEDHSAKDRTTKMNNYFPPKRFKKWPTFGGVMEAGHIENNYHLFNANGQKWIIVGLEWGPRDTTLEWADKILQQYSNRKALIFTHAYLYDDSTRYDWAKKGTKQDWNPHAYSTAGSVNDGEEMWHKLIKKHANVFMVINGHVCHDGLGFEVSTGENGNTVNEMIVDYQGREFGGGAWLCVLEFLPEGKTVQVKTYSPLYDKYDSSPDNQFTFSIDQTAVKVK